MKNNELNQVATEMCAIFDNMSQDVLQKIPMYIIQHFRDNRTKSNSFVYDYNKKLYEQDLTDKTKGIIAYIYKEYICTEEERQEYTKEYNSFLEKINGPKVAFDANNAFMIQNKKEEKQEMPIVAKKLKWYQKIMSIIKDIFKK